VRRAAEGSVSFLGGGFGAVVVVVVVVVIVRVVMVGGFGGMLLLLLMAADILVVEWVAEPLGKADIGIAVATMAEHCCCAAEWKVGW